MIPATKGVLWACLTGFCWAVLAIVLKYTSGFMSSGSIAWMRMSVASGILVAFFIFKSPATYKKLVRSPPLLCLLGALLLSFNYFGFMKGVELTTASNAQIMIQSGPLMLLLAGVFYFRETLRPIQWAGVISAALGFAFFHFDQRNLNLSGAENYTVGNLWILGGALSWALFAVFQKILLRKNWKPSELNLLTYFICALALIGPANFSEFTNLNFEQYAIMAFLGVNTVVAYGAFAEAMNLIPASHVSLIITCNPLLTIILVQLMTPLGIDIIPPEPLGVKSIFGAILVILGVATAVGAPILFEKHRTKSRLKKMNPLV